MFELMNQALEAFLEGSITISNVLCLFFFFSCNLQSWSEELVNQALEAISCTSSASQVARPRGEGLAFNQGQVENGELIDIISDWLVISMIIIFDIIHSLF